jgi:hypothetical protein
MVELTLLAPEAERVATFLQRTLDRLSAGERGRSTLLPAMPAIDDADLPTSIRLRWIDIHAQDPAAAEAQVVAWFAVLTAPLQPVGIAASHVEEHPG